ncbi:hypothetical protein C8A03DRAFT_40743 [Achaetomium macrosporum]|uniref:Adenosine deaminase domain-containing protein n=1 Tax=Achaetomium macrosporum TaxID=79813 RepID=A0AAN7HH73_9PEZI|nr:hypothetical protein C8A03DRAFT_40743 [Achaetomium macrosporum]
MTGSQTIVVDYKALPKIELHAHLSGSISRQCLHEIWVMKKAAGETSLQDRPFFPLFSSYIYNLINDAATLRYATLSVLRDFAADGVVYLELRTAPRAMPGAGLTGRLRPDHSGHHRRIDRRHTPTQASQVLLLAKHFLGRGVVGIDLGGNPAVPLHPAVGLIFEEARRVPGMGMMLHFAEAECSASDAELDMLLGWRPERIGHVIHVSDRVKRNIVRRPGIGLELCLSCNVHAGMIHGGFESHHFAEWWKVEETVVVLSTDDVGVFGSPLSNEYALVARHFGLNHAEICALVRKGVDVIFGGEEEKRRLRSILCMQ